MQLKKSTLATVIPASVFCGIYVETQHAYNIIPLGSLPLLHAVGLLFYSTLAFAFTMVAASMLYRGFKKSVWSLFSQEKFNFTMVLSALSLTEGFDYMMAEWWDSSYLIYLFFFKAFLISLSVILLRRMIVLQRAV